MSVFATVTSLLLLNFLTAFLGVPAIWAAVAIFVPKVWDIITDPIIGYLSDRTRSEWGRRRPYLLVGSIVLGCAYFLMFAVPDFSDPMSRALYVAVMFTAAATGYALFSVPYVALPAEMTQAYHERTKLVSFRVVFLLLGILVAGAVAPIIVESVATSRSPNPSALDFRHGYRVMGMSLGTIITMSMLWTFFALRHAPQKDAVDSTSSIRQQLIVAFRNRPFFQLLLPYFMQLLAVNCTVASMPFFVQYILGNRNAFASTFLCLIVPSILAMPLWAFFSRRFGKLSAYMMSIALFTAALLSLLWADPTRMGFFYVQMGLAGVAYAGTQLFPFAMLPDVIQLDEHLSGLRREGAYTGVWMAGEKTGVAFGTFLAGAILAICGFQESTTGATEQTEAAIWGVRLAFIVLPSILLAASLPLLARYDLSEERLSQIRSHS